MRKCQWIGASDEGHMLHHLGLCTKRVLVLQQPLHSHVEDVSILAKQKRQYTKHQSGQVGAKIGNIHV